jgi:hypothetical protein
MPSGRRIAEWDKEGRDIGLGAGMCRWPVGRPPANMEEQRFCAMPVDDGQSYCPHCRKRAFRGKLKPMAPGTFGSLLRYA